MADFNINTTIKCENLNPTSDASVTATNLRKRQLKSYRRLKSGFIFLIVAVLFTSKKKQFRKMDKPQQSFRQNKSEGEGSFGDAQTHLR